MSFRSFVVAGAVGLWLAGCGAPPPHASAPCFDIHGDGELRAKDADRTLEELAKDIHLSPADEALRDPKSLADIRAILQRDTIYHFRKAASFARAQNSLDGRLAEATLELLLGESQLVASEVLSVQAAWVGGDLRVARASFASDPSTVTTGNDRTRMLGQLIRVVEEGNKVADALGAVGPLHLARGAVVVRGLRTEAPDNPRTSALVAEYHRLRGEWPEFEASMAKAEAGVATGQQGSPALCYLRAMEQMERRRRHDRAETMLRECLTRYPKFVRAQASLVLIAKNPAAALRELGKLKVMNEDHYLVMLLEPTLAADQELQKLQQGSADAGRDADGS